MSLLGSDDVEHALLMATEARKQFRKAMAVRGLSLLIFGLALGWVYGWAAPRFYGNQRPASFGLGMLHGALMPTALPSLIIGKDVPIFASLNDGRMYKLGYIAGINLCGMIFFGIAFKPPKPPSS